MMDQLAELNIGRSAVSRHPVPEATVPWHSGQAWMRWRSRFSSTPFRSIDRSPVAKGNGRIGGSSVEGWKEAVELKKIDFRRLELRTHANAPLRIAHIPHQDVAEVKSLALVILIETLDSDHPIATRYPL